MDVPKIIWQTHNYEFDDLPVHLKKVTQNWKNLNPGWDYRYVSYNQRLESIRPYDDLFKHYLKQDPVRQSDIWRYLVTYDHGGVYADMDSVCIKPLDYMLSSINDCELLLVPANSHIGSTINNSNFAIKPSSQIMKNVIDHGQYHIRYNQPEHIPDTWYWFVDEVAKANNVSYDFTSSWHTMEFKTEFDPDFFVDDYGTKIKYLDFINKYNLKYF